MGLTRHAITFGLGYAVGDPAGRRSLLALREKVAELARRPEVKQARERAWDVAGDAVLATRNRLAARSRSNATTGAPKRSWRNLRLRPASGAAASAAAPDGAADDTRVPELAGTTVAEDSQAALLGSAPPRSLQQPGSGAS